MANKFGKDFSIVGAVALAKGQVKNDFSPMTRAENLIDIKVKEKNILKGCPFLWIGIIYRYGTKNDLNVDFQRINKKQGDLPISLELNMEILKWADQNNLDLLHDIYMIAALEAVIQVGLKYKLPTTVFEYERAKYGNIPNTIEECEEYNSNMIIVRHETPVNDIDSIEDEFETEDEGSFSTLIIEYPVIGMGTENDLKKRYSVQDLVHQLLSKSELGYCDGGSIGSGSMEICCFVTDYQRAHEIIKLALENTVFGDYSKIYKEE